MRSIISELVMDSECSFNSIIEFEIVIYIRSKKLNLSRTIYYSLLHTATT